MLDIKRSTQGFYRDNGKEDGNYFNWLVLGLYYRVGAGHWGYIGALWGLYYRVSTGVILGLYYRVHIGVILG